MSSSQAVHVWSRCHHCGVSPIVGPLFACETCPAGPDTQLCSNCHEGYQHGSIKHPRPDAPGSFSAPGPHHFTRKESSPATHLESWISIPGRAERAPPVPARFLVRPEFCFGPRSAFGGYGFIVEFKGRTLLLTALHVMDELIKAVEIDSTAANRTYSGKELPAKVSSVRMYDVLQKQWLLYELGDAGPMLVLPDARTGDEEPYSFRDLAAFRVATPGSLSAGRLGTRDPEPGDPVWVAAAMPDGSHTRRATCVEQSESSFVFRYEEAKEVAKYSSGAPILDAQGAVVGVNVGSGHYAGRQFGHANPLRSILAHLASGVVG
jgi:Trypsin-like peptidase domain